MIDTGYITLFKISLAMYPIAHNKPIQANKYSHIKLLPHAIVLSIIYLPISNVTLV